MEQSLPLYSALQLVHAEPAQKPRAPTPGAAMHAIVAAAHADWLFDPKFNGWDAKE